MTTKISSSNIQTATLTELKVPKISNVQVTNSSYTVLDDTAVDIAGGYIKLTGTGFESGCQLLINNTPATSVTFVSSTEVRAQVPATAAGSYVVYLINADGGVAIRINGITFSATPAWVTGSTLDSAASDTAISIQLSATGATTYALQAGSSLPAGLTLSSGGLLSGAVTGLTTETTYNFTILATDAENQDSPRAFSITITTGDQYFKNTSLLLSANTPSATFVTDASTNAFNVSVLGDTRPNNFNPYLGGYYSNYFDGTGDFLNPGTQTAFAFGTGNFTVECWIYATAASDSSIYEGRADGSTSDGFTITAFSSSVIRIFSGSVLISSTGTNYLNQWTHVAVSRVSGTTTLYINGVSVGTSTSLGNNTTGSAVIGGGRYGGGTTVNSYFTGYISNFRIVKGTAVYTANFTPSTSPLTAITNTSLLTCQSNRFIDNSTNNFSITRNGDIRVTSFLPYTPAVGTSTYGSGYFDGNGDYMAVANNAAFNCGTGDFTLECWFYDDGTSTSYPSIFSSTDWATGTGGISLRYNNTGAANKFMVAYYASNGTPTGGSGVNELLRTTNTYPTKTWHHVAFVRSAGNVFSLYVNGVRDATTTSSEITIDWSLNANGPKIGGGNWDGANSYIKGYVADLRLVKGTAVYTGTTYTVPTAPLTAISGTSLLTCQSNQPANNNVFLDNSTNNFAITRNGNTTQGTFSPYGENWSLANQNTTDVGIGVATNSALNLGTSNFTIECWVNLSYLPTSDSWITTAGGYQAIFATGPNSSATGSQLYIGTTNIKFDVVSDGSGPINVAHGMTPGTWYHLALTRSGSTISLYKNGVLLQSGTDSNAMPSGYGWGIARAEPLTYWSGGWLTGYISNFRLVTGSVLYTTTFTPSATPLQAVAGTQLLLCQSNYWKDNSPNNFTVGTGGNVPSVQKYSPFAGTTLPTPYYSAYFDGNGDYLTVPDNTALQMGSGDFTIEFYIYYTSIAGFITPFSKGYTAAGDILFQTGNGNGAMVIYLSGSAAITESTGAIVNQWYHYALVRSGTTVTLYRNGVSTGTVTSSVNFNSSQQVGIGATGTAPGGGAVGNYPVTGYISNVRLVKGTAVYTAAFTPPTSPLTAVANTVLLTCQSSTFIDNSTNNFTITANGDTKPRTFSPFTVTYSTKQSYAPAVFGGSMYFDGNGDGLTIADATLLAFGTNDFTIEFWIYLTGSSSTTPGNILHGGLNGGFGLYLVSTGIQIARYNTGGDLTYSGTVTLNSWTHLAFARKSGTGYIFLNGAQVASGAVSTNYGASSFNFGGGNALYYSDLRVIKGRALYTSGFVPENRPLQAIQNSTLLLNGTSSGIYNSAMTGNFETTGTARLSTAVTKFTNATSMYFDGSSTLITYKNTALYGAPRQFTAECWVYITNTGVTSGIIGCWDSSAGNAGWAIWCTGTAFKLIFGSVSFNSTWEYSNLGSVTANTWTHIAFVRTENGANNVMRFFVNGTSVLNAEDSNGDTRYAGSPAEGYPFGVGVGPGLSSSRFSGTVNMNGYISDVRITRGYARYTSNFTAPASPFMSK